VIIIHKIIAEIITDHHHLSVMVIYNIQDGITLNKIIIETIIGRHHHSGIIINGLNMITHEMTHKIIVCACAACNCGSAAD